MFYSINFLQNSYFRLLRFARNDSNCEKEQQNNDRHCEEERRSNLSYARSLIKRRHVEYSWHVELQHYKKTFTMKEI